MKGHAFRARDGQRCHVDFAAVRSTTQRERPSAVSAGRKEVLMARDQRRNGRPAGTVLWHVTMSLDGFIVGPADVMDWILRYSGPREASSTRAIMDEVVGTTGAVLMGRRSYDVGRRKGQRAEFSTVYGGGWTGPQFVLTHRAPDTPEDPTITFL